MRKVLLTVPVAALSLALSACGGSSKPQFSGSPGSDASASSTAPTVAPTTHAPKPTATVDPAKVIAAFMGDIGKRDVAAAQAAAAYVVPKSPAAQYVTYEIATATWGQNNAVTLQASTTTKVSDAVWKLCDPSTAGQPPSCVQVDSFKLVGGKIDTFNTAGLPLEQRLVPVGPPVTTNQVTLSPVSAYRSGEGTPSLVVLATVTNGTASDLSVLSNLATYQEADGTTVQAQSGTGQLTLHPGGKGLTDSCS